METELLTELLGETLDATTLAMVVTVTTGGFQMVKTFIPTKLKMLIASLFGMGIMAVAVFAHPLVLVILFGGTITGNIALLKKKK